MSRLRVLLIAAVAALLLFCGAVAGAYYYFFGAPEMSAAELVPANTIAFATIPNGALLVDAYESSAAKTLLSSPNVKPVHDLLVGSIGKDNVDLLHVFLPNLSGQSFIAVTRYDPDHPENIGLIAGMKPKAGLGDFGAFLDKLKATYPDFIKQGTTGRGQIEGHDYDWIQGPNAPNKICVANIRGWIITTWGPDALQDWIERFENRSTTSSLADDVDYRNALARVGDDPMTLAYVNYRGFYEIFQKQINGMNPQVAAYLGTKVDEVGGAAVATRFENGQIVDRYSLLIPRPDQAAAGLTAEPCNFETLKFTGRDTRFYWAGNVDWKQWYEDLKAQQHPQVENAAPASTPPPDAAAGLVALLQDWVRREGLDVQHNFIDALGPEVSLQAEWPDDAAFPSVGLLVKLDKPDNFKPVVSAIIDTAQKQYGSAVAIKQSSLPGQDFATLNYLPSGVLTPTITESGSYFGVFLTDGQAKHSFQRDAAVSLAHSDNFTQQIGDKRTGAQQIAYVDSPYMLNRAYKSALPYLSLAAMFNKNVAGALQGHQLPDDLGWLAPMGTWSCVVTTDEGGVQAYSVSGIGNQGIFLSGLAGGTVDAGQMLGLLPKNLPFPLPGSALGTPPAPPPAVPSTVSLAPAPATAPATNAAPNHASAPPPAATP